MPGTAHTLHTVATVGCDILHIEGGDIQAASTPGTFEKTNALYLGNIGLWNDSASSNTYTLVFEQGDVGVTWKPILKRKIAPGEQYYLTRSVLARLFDGRFRVTCTPTPPALDTHLQIDVDYVPYSLMVPVV